MSPPGSTTPEERARIKIDAALEASGWAVQDRDLMNITAAKGVAVREFKLAQGHGYADYLLFVDGKAVGVLEAKPEGHTLTGVEPQAKKYAAGLPATLKPPVKPLPFLYISTGSDTRFTNLLDLKPKSRRIFQIHRPETLAEWLSADPLDHWLKTLHAEGSGFYSAADATRPSTLRTRISTLPPLDQGHGGAGQFRNQIEAIVNLERSLKQDKPRALIQMATGSGKTRMAVTSIYRLIKFGGARRVLFLVDRANLGEQAETEFQSYRTPDDNRKFTELYGVQRLTTNTIGASTKVAITTIQRLYSMLKGEPDLDPTLEEEGAQLTPGAAPANAPLPVVYSSAYPPEYFDVIFIDECHRSIYSLWRQVLEYFDAYLVGLTATPAAHTFGFFNQNLVMEYSHERAVADGVNVQFMKYDIRTKITEKGSIIEAGPDTILKVRARSGEKWLKPDEDITYQGKDLDNSVVAPDQIRLVMRTFKERLRTEIFPERKEVPKTLIFAKDDRHAEAIVEIVRDEFGQGNEFCQKITYKTTGTKPADLIRDFRMRFNPRIAVTVDMIATGTDIRPVEIVMFMRSVKSRVLFEQMKGRGVRVIDRDELRSVTPEALAKTHFVVIDCVGVADSALNDTQPLERKPTVPLKKLLETVAAGSTDADVLSSVAGRLARLDRECSVEERRAVAELSGGLSLSSMTAGIVAALDPDEQVKKAREMFGLPASAEPSEKQVEQAAEALAKAAVAPLATKPELRKKLQELRSSHDQIIDHLSRDELLVEKTGFSKDVKDQARSLVSSFEAFLAENKDEIDALQFFYSVPHRDRLRFKDIKALAEAIQAPPRSWTPEALWRAYELLAKDKVKRASGQRLLTDIVSLVRFALHQKAELKPFSEEVRERFDSWMAQQANKGRKFSDAQVRWLEMMRDHIATSLEVEVDDFDYAPFAEAGGLGRATQVFGKELTVILRELNEVLAA
ncbi:MAG: DEAD/DEAH box helicase family protein [Polyangiaceae bacterium]|nr:DEAD/DEAH box helicase family protein [Polyangiaceae bacterium]